MVKKKVDQRTKDFMEFFEKEIGVKFIDIDTGEDIEPTTEE